MKFFKKVTLLLLCLLVLSIGGCKVDESKTVANVVDPMETAIKSFSGLDMQSEEVLLNIEGNDIKLSLPIYVEKNRYYIPLTEIAQKLSGNIKDEEDNITVNILGEEVKVYKKTKKFEKDGQEKNMKKNLIEKDGVYYVTFNDFTRMFNMVTRWNQKDKSIKAYKNRKKNMHQKYQKKIDTEGFIRLEDVSIEAFSNDSGYYQTLRVIGENLNDRGIPFSIAWIPKYVNPNSKMEYDPSKTNNININELIYTLDDLDYKGGIIGLHGYTHQRNNDESGLGTEFGPHNPDLKDMNERVEKAITLAKEMDIDISFFEAPHYDITKAQNEALENKFKIIYNPYRNNHGKEANTTKLFKSPGGKSTFIGTPLEYVREADNGEGICQRIKNLPPEVIGSLFYHPRLESRYIKFYEEEDGYPNYEQDENSILNKIVNSLQERGYDMKDLRKL